MFFIYFTVMPTSEPAIKPTTAAAAESYTVLVGGTHSILVNISSNNQHADFYYLSSSHSKRIIKLPKGDHGNGTCYHNVIQWRKCQKHYGLRYLGEKAIIIQLKEATKSMEDWYGLYAYCQGSNHKCDTEQPMKSFMLNIEDKLESMKVTTVETGSDPTEPVSSVEQNPTQETKVTTSTGSGSQGPVSKGVTNLAVIAGAVSGVIFVVLTLIGCVCWYYHSSNKRRVSETAENAIEMS